MRRSCLTPLILLSCSGPVEPTTALPTDAGWIVLLFGIGVVVAPTTVLRRAFAAGLGAVLATVVSTVADLAVLAALTVLADKLLESEK